MLVKLTQIKLSEEALSKLAKLPLPIAVSFKLSELIKIAGEALLKLENKRVEFILKLGKQDESGNTSVPDDKIEEFQSKMLEELMKDIELPDIVISVEAIEKAIELFIKQNPGTTDFMFTATDINNIGYLLDKNNKKQEEEIIEVVAE